MQAKNIDSRYQQGFSILGVLMAIGVLGLLAPAINNIVVSGFKSDKHISRKFELIAIKKMLSESISCSETLPSGTCVSNANIKLLRLKGATSVTIVPLEGKVLGNTAVKGVCNSTGNGVIIKTAFVRSGTDMSNIQSSDYVKDPLTGKMGYKFEDTEGGSNLLKAGESFCGGAQNVMPLVYISSCDTGNARSDDGFLKTKTCPCTGKHMLLTGNSTYDYHIDTTDGLGSGVSICAVESQGTSDVSGVATADGSTTTEIWHGCSFSCFN
jgi:hypothetical protein